MAIRRAIPCATAILVLSLPSLALAQDSDPAPPPGPAGPGSETAEPSPATESSRELLRQIDEALPPFQLLAGGSAPDGTNREVPPWLKHLDQAWWVILDRRAEWVLFKYEQAAPAVVLIRRFVDQTDPLYPEMEPLVRSRLPPEKQAAIDRTVDQCATLRRVSRFLEWDAYRLHEAGRYDDAVDRLVLHARFIKRLSTEPYVMFRLTDGAVLDLYLRQLTDWSVWRHTLPFPELNAEQRRRVRKGLLELDWNDPCGLLDNATRVADRNIDWLRDNVRGPGGGERLAGLIRDLAPEGGAYGDWDSSPDEWQRRLAAMCVSARAAPYAEKLTEADVDHLLAEAEPIRADMTGPLRASLVTTKVEQILADKSQFLRIAVGSLPLFVSTTERDKARLEDAMQNMLY
ncbi:MAG: hypothetical protein H6810_03625 [Phycisphaeraceae bacterium]|nr:MAG: hypothetical protein H6810_03625 [Phycisphaeraceae bacterium]